MNQGMEPEPHSPNVMAAGRFSVRCDPRLPLAVGGVWCTVRLSWAPRSSSSLRARLFTSAEGSPLCAPSALPWEGPGFPAGAAAAVPAAGTVGTR